ncbi:hypothetical protein Cgig2_016648 [Carnegiea gigantea]|uniref:Serpin domain-containing protein n=1 Tax=Carnegiea gigantea TaxID=171969 RepID=A0A9Q1QRP4_9CARY|nr:hypothetical protein Cgig2_016648 [Carnegiea gigantea]
MRTWCALRSQSPPCSTSRPPGWRAISESSCFLARDSMDEVSDMASRLADVLREGDDEDAPDIKFANALRVADRLHLRETFREILGKVDFESQVDQVVKEANLRAEEQTKGLIKQILSGGSIGKDTMMIFANAPYFKGAKFKPKNTKEMLYREGEEESSDKEENTRRFSMYIFLPNKKDGLPNLMENLTVDANMFEERVKLNEVSINEIRIPKFSFECDLSLSEPMKQFGLTLPFDRSSCELTGMLDNPNEGEQPHVSGRFKSAVWKPMKEGQKPHLS